MANKSYKFESSPQERHLRHFSLNFKKEKVREIELGRLTVLEVSKQYEVSTVNVYRWMSKFGTMKKKKERIVVESQSDAQQLLALKKRVAELERLVGQKQILIEFKEKMIDIAEEMYGIDIKKNFPADSQTLLAQQRRKLLQPERALSKHRHYKASST